jgi:hypothetical protein
MRHFPQASGPGCFILVEGFFDAENFFLAVGSFSIVSAIPFGLMLVHYCKVIAYLFTLRRSISEAVRRASFKKSGHFNTSYGI